MHGMVGEEDLLTEIFLRLPVKDLLRCKFVCQKWNSLISDSKSRFGYLHTLGLCRKNKHNPYLYPSGIIVRPSSWSLEKLKIITFPNDTKNWFYYHLHHLHNKFDGHGQFLYYFLRSCNGLLLWNISSKEVLGDDDELVHQEWSFYVSNPTTGHCVRIDRFGHDNFNASCSKPYLVFDPWKSPHFKIIFFNQLTTEIMDLPTLPLTPQDSYFLRVCGRNLHWITFKSNNIWEFDIWELKEDYSGWILRFHVDLTTLQHDLHAHSFDTVFGVAYQPPNEDEEEESVLVIIAVDNFMKIASYNLKNRRSRILYRGDGRSAPTLHGLYFETLISI
ncbi:hypothetical protein PIB30_073158 [Stylosanthes scabra]|uniref:F-box domain-containing protein n=1 Tax=Stylosanthes scabra TaxID=79078 RepID=A0ABU6WS48_9FABA|nr:hypothetical protein [Stylosanthes scabra]